MSRHVKVFGRSDIAQLVVGANVLAFPIAATEEIWNLSEQLSVFQTLAFVTLSCVFLSAFIHYIHRVRVGDHGREGFRLHVVRLVATYGITLIISAGILALIGKFPLFDDTGIALTRMVLVAFPASFSATVVDSLS